MNRDIQSSAIDTLPNEVLAVILEQVADLPATSREWRQPFPLPASFVSRHWRDVTLSFPELWTNIRISRHSRTWRLAAIFLKRSQSQPLDISINLEAYSGGCAFISLSRILDVVGPHLARFRRIALRGLRRHLEEFCQFVLDSPIPASQLKSAHLSLVNDWYCNDADSWYWNTALTIFASATLQALRINGIKWDLNPLVASGSLRSLDIHFPIVYCVPDFQQILFGPASSITTLIVRGFTSFPNEHPIDAPQLRSFAVSFACHGGFKALTETFLMPNLEYLELNGFTSEAEDDRTVQIPEEWEAPPFPHLRTLRLEKVVLGPNALALLQFSSPGITTLELIRTFGKYHLLSPRSDREAPWPFLRSFTVGTSPGGINRDWLPVFVATRPGLALHMVAQSAQPLCRLPSSRGLIDGFAHERGFFVDDLEMREVDFEYVEPPSWSECQNYFGEPGWTWTKEDDLERWEAEIEEELHSGGEFIRAKGLLRERRKEERKRFRRAGQRNKTRRSGIEEDFWL
ncbi:hypothetical protein C8J57DRAFT_1316849 [Mycena rebaudengoi]|nr:hypothetical protein C8J57DRAFT_1316849 [Mycena rebaudengoi]